MCSGKDAAGIKLKTPKHHERQAVFRLKLADKGRVKLNIKLLIQILYIVAMHCCNACTAVLATNCTLHKVLVTSVR